MAVTVPQYASRMANAIPGLLFGTTEHVVNVKKAGEDIAFGSPLFAQAADAHEVKASDSTKALALVGVAGFERNTAGCYVDDMPVNCVTKGYIYIKMSGTIKEGEAVYVKYADGSFVSETTKNAGTAADFVALNAYAIEAGVDGGIVPVYLRG